MSNAVYPSALDAFGTAEIDYASDTIKIQLLSATYTYSSSHDFFNDITGAIDSPQTLAGKSVSAGEFYADDAVFPAVATGSTIKAYVVYKDTGTSSTSALIAYVDTRADTVPISVATNDGDVTVAFASGKVFKI